MPITKALKRCASGAAVVASLGFIGATTTTATAAAADDIPEDIASIGIMSIGSGVNNCYGEYFTNRWSSTCEKASKAGDYRTSADCSGTNKYGAWISIGQWTSARGFSAGTCYPSTAQWASTQYRP
jgi:hypothetical protein